MPFTKVGNDLIKEADGLVSALVGSYRTSKLTDSEKKTLRKKHNLPEDANLALRNAGRGILGGL